MQRSSININIPINSEGEYSAYEFTLQFNKLYEPYSLNTFRQDLLFIPTVIFKNFERLRSEILGTIER